MTTTGIYAHGDGPRQPEWTSRQDLIIGNFDLISITTAMRTGDISALRRVARLFKSIEATTTPSSAMQSPDVFIQLLLDAIEGYEMAARLRANTFNSEISWLSSHELELKEHLNAFRSFASYVTYYHPASGHTDQRLLKARQKLQKLCPRINNLATWNRQATNLKPYSPSTTNLTTHAQKRRLPESDQEAIKISKRVKTQYAVRQLPTPQSLSPAETNIGLSFEDQSSLASCSQDTIITIPPSQQSSPIPTRILHRCIGGLDGFNGWIEQPTRPFDSGVILSPHLFRPPEPQPQISKQTRRGRTANKRNSGTAYHDRKVGNAKPPRSPDEGKKVGKYSGYGMSTWPRCDLCQRKIVFDDASSRLMYCDFCEGVLF